MEHQERSLEEQYADAPPYIQAIVRRYTELRRRLENYEAFLIKDEYEICDEREIQQLEGYEEECLDLRRPLRHNNEYPELLDRINNLMELFTECASLYKGTIMDREEATLLRLPESLPADLKVPPPYRPAGRAGRALPAVPVATQVPAPIDLAGPTGPPAPAAPVFFRPGPPPGPPPAPAVPVFFRPGPPRPGPPAPPTPPVTPSGPTRPARSAPGDRYRLIRIGQGYARRLPRRRKSPY
ncbi:hypothetical protein F5Y06DRAFT_298532 [Hypoxylon sp. FL0890]|nr:hypothetical protein F5Y06DRAFT_298532 [Hypoxylon sp. FL0890]